MSSPVNWLPIMFSTDGQMKISKGKSILKKIMQVQ